MSCFLVTAWEALAKFEKKSIWDYPVEFSKVTVYQPVRAERTEKVKLGVLFDFSSHFQVNEVPSRPLFSPYLLLTAQGSE